MADDEQFDDERPSKSQRKRELSALKEVGEKLLSVPADQLRRLDNPDLVNAIMECKRITKGNARKRQLQYIGKLLRLDADMAIRIIDEMDAGTRAHNAKFHQLETWREQLIADEADIRSEAMATVMDAHPDMDRQHFRHLVNNAIAEKAAASEPPVHYRKLFQYLKSLEEL